MQLIESRHDLLRRPVGHQGRDRERQLGLNLSVPGHDETAAELGQARCHGSRDAGEPAFVVRFRP
jgi:hypothetical protein